MNQYSSGKGIPEKYHRLGQDLFPNQVLWFLTSIWVYPSTCPHDYIGNPLSIGVLKGRAQRGLAPLRPGTKRKKIMSIDTYKLTSMEEPTDEVLSQLMREAAEEARETNAQATQRFFDELRQAAANIR